MVQNNNIHKMSRILLVAFVCLTVAVGLSRQLCFNQICSSNSHNTIRGCDRRGCGYYGASRSGRKHKGIDINCDPGSDVLAPFPGKILRRSWPYRNNNEAHNNGLYLQGSGSWTGYRAKIFYMTPNINSGSMTSRQILGTSVKLPYSGITQHIHIQLYKGGGIVDPTSYVC